MNARACLMLGIMLVAARLVYAGETEFQNPSPAPRHFGTQGNALTYVVLGDSTAAGRGADYEKGIAVSTARALAEMQARAVTLVNLAVSGAKAADVAGIQLPAAIALKPDVVLLAVGANDVTHLTPLFWVRGTVQRIVSGLRRANPRVAIVVTGAPDMSAPPRIPGLLRGIAGMRTNAMNRMFRALATHDRIIFAPIADDTGLSFRSDHTLFTVDGFHPNERGYALWVPVLDTALKQALQAQHGAADTTTGSMP